MVVPTQTSSSSCWALLWCCYQTRTGMMGKDEVREADLNMPWYTRCACFLLLSKFGRSTTPEQAWLQLLLEGGGESKNKNLLANWNEQLDIKNSCVWYYFAHFLIKVIITSLKVFFFLFCLVFILLLDRYSHFSPWAITGLNTFIVPSKQLFQMYQNSFSQIFQLNT